MKKLYFLAISFLGICTSLTAQTYQNNTATPDAVAEQRATGCGYGVQPGVQMSSITIPLVGTIADASKITINLSLTSAWLGDVTVDLINPQGQAITLIRRLGANLVSSCGDSSKFGAANILSFNSTNTTAIDHTIPSTETIPAGNYKPTYGSAPYPTHNPGTLADFLPGKKLDGEWRLILYDYGVGEPSTIASWQMIVGNGATMKTKEAGVFGNDISLKQNPVQDQLLLNVKDDFKSLSLGIYDASGKLVKNENILRGSKDFQVDVRNLSPGMYLLVPIKDGEKKQSIKFIKN